MIFISLPHLGHVRELSSKILWINRAQVEFALAVPFSSSVSIFAPLSLLFLCFPSLDRNCCKLHSKKSLFRMVREYARLPEP